VTTITKHTVLDLEPANANWMVSVEREDYANPAGSDPAEESGVLLSVGRTTVMLTLAEAKTIGAALHAAVTSAQMAALMDALAAVADEDEADDDAPETCERCDGSGIHLGDNPGTPRHHECAGCDGTGRP
jgi:hypothetical protein